MEGKRCLIAGGGKVAHRKILNIIDFDIEIKVVSPEFIPEIKRLADENRISIVERGFEESYLAGADIVFAATNNEKVNRRIFDEARRRRIPVNVVDNPPLCDFIVPAEIRRGPLTISVCTEGCFPLLSKKIKKELAERYEGDYESYLALLGEMRDFVVKNIDGEMEKKELLGRLLDSDMLSVLRREGFDKAREFAMKIIEGYKRKS